MRFARKSRGGADQGEPQRGGAVRGIDRSVSDRATRPVVQIGGMEDAEIVGERNDRRRHEEGEIERDEDMTTSGWVDLRRPVHVSLSIANTDERKEYRFYLGPVRKNAEPWRQRMESFE